MNSSSRSASRPPLAPTTKLAVLALAAVLASGCASINTISSEVSSYGDWPPTRSAGTYAFERLPSQEAQPEEQATLEAAARGAIERAGFKAADAARADVLVQVAARSSRQAYSPWDDPYWPRWSIGYGRGSYRWGLNAHWAMTSNPRLDREVAVLLRDRASGKTLYETRAVNSGFSGIDMTLLTAMFDAAMKDFPKPAINPRRVDITLPSATAPVPEPTAPTPKQTQVIRQ